MDLFTSVPLIAGKPINIWFGLVLLSVMILQFYLGIAMMRGDYGLIRYHKVNGAVIAFVLLIHAYYGIGVWFFGIQYGR